MKETIWDLDPVDGGGKPVQITMESIDASEAIARHPDRYTRVPPAGTPHAAAEGRQAARSAEISAINEEENKKLNELAVERQKKLDAVAVTQKEEAKKAEETRRAKEAKEREEAGLPPSHDGELAQINQDHNNSVTEVQAEYARKRAEVLRKPDSDFPETPAESSHPSPKAT